MSSDETLLGDLIFYESSTGKVRVEVYYEDESF